MLWEVIKLSNKNDIDISKISKVLRDSKRNIFYITTLGFALSIFYIFITTPYYQSYISINPIGDNVNSSRSTGGLQSLASEYGVNPVSYTHLTLPTKRIV